MKIQTKHNYLNSNLGNITEHKIERNTNTNILYTKSITESRVFPEMYRYKHYQYYNTMNRTDYVKKNFVSAGYTKYIEHEKAENVKKYKEYHYL